MSKLKKKSDYISRVKNLAWGKTKPPPPPPLEVKWSVPYDTHSTHLGLGILSSI